MAAIGLKIDMLVNIVAKIVHRFVEIWASKRMSRRRKYNHVDISLSPSKNYSDEKIYYSIQLTNCAQCPCDLFTFANDIFSDVISTLPVPDNSTIAVIHWKNAENNYDVIYNLESNENNFCLEENNNEENGIIFPCWKEYLSIKLKHKLPSSDADQFKQTVLNIISEIQPKHPNLKFTYHMDGNPLYNNHIKLDDDYKSCKVLCIALTKIIKQSVNDDFRDSCFNTLNINNSYQAYEALMSKLLPKFHENYVFTESRASDEKNGDLKKNPKYNNDL